MQRRGEVKMRLLLACSAIIVLAACQDNVTPPSQPPATAPGRSLP